MGYNTIGVVGCGIMGSGIAQVTAGAGYPTVVREITPELLDAGMDKLKQSLAKAVDRGKLDEAQMEATLENLSGTLELRQLANCDLIIEAISEERQLKQDLFSTLDNICPEKTVFASNTSSLTIAELASFTKRPERFLGLHFFNPAPRMPLVEVVKSLHTTDETYRQCLDFIDTLDKTAIQCKDDSGFVVNRLLVPYLLDAVRAVENGIASIAAIDKAMQLGCGHPMGPLTLLDFVGLDTTLHIANIMYNEFHENHYAPPPLLRKMVYAGFHGKKTGTGFYDYSGDKPEPVSLNL